VLIGDLELHPLADAVGLLGEYAEVYPEVALEAWEPYRELYPDLFAATSWRLPCSCYLIRSGGSNALVDTGVGPPGLWDWTPEREGGLPTELEALGVARDEVDVVFLTHLHIDHLGWNADVDSEVYFPRARYVVHRDALAFARTRPELPHIRRCVEALVDRFEKVVGDTELVPGVTPFVSLGHHPGHMGLRLVAGGQEAVLLADTAVHPALLDRPDWRYVSDLDPCTAAATRDALLPDLVDRDVLVVCGHYPGTGIGRLVTQDGRVVWTEAT
jgi:glyoxylase-like metal-dependent hydrolase (beta-lactamase superfamily II)